MMTLRNSLVPSRTPFRPAPFASSIFYLDGMASQPVAVKILVDRKYAPVPASAVARATYGARPML